MNRMNRQQQLLTAMELQADLHEYMHDVDTNWGAGIGEYYADDALFEFSHVRLKGRDAIERFFRWRKDRGMRTSVHVVSNYFVAFDDQGWATAHWTMSVYAADGAPVLPTRPPVGINRVTDRLRHDADRQRWVCHHRRVVSVFEGGSTLRLPNFSKSRGTASWASQSLIPMPI